MGRRVWGASSKLHAEVNLLKLERELLEDPKALKRWLRVQREQAEREDMLSALELEMLLR